MLSPWRARTLFREVLIAFFCALSVLAGVMQARAGTEFAAKSGFASTLTLCQPGGSGGDAPEPQPDCDHCRMPAPLCLEAPFAQPLSLRIALLETAPAATPTLFTRIRTILPEARGPPQQG